VRRHHKNCVWEVGTILNPKQSSPGFLLFWFSPFLLQAHKHSDFGNEVQLNGFHYFNCVEGEGFKNGKVCEDYSEGQEEWSDAYKWWALGCGNL
jgi:hypothetical protein